MIVLILTIDEGFMRNNELILYLHGFIYFECLTHLADADFLHSLSFLFRKTNSSENLNLWHLQVTRILLPHSI